MIPRHLQLAVRNDEEFNRLFAHVIMSEGGVLPHIESALLPKRVPKKTTKDEDD